MNKIVNWLVFSSKDSTKFSLALKSFGTLVITALTVVFRFYNVPMPTADLTAIVDTGIALTQAILMVVSFLTTLYGLFRKLWTTYKGTNAVINDPLALNS